jgi:hypothetical protein
MMDSMSPSWGGKIEYSRRLRMMRLSGAGIGLGFGGFLLQDPSLTSFKGKEYEGD